MLTGRHRTHAALAGLLLTIGAGSPVTSIERLAEYRDAFVDFDARTSEWTIGNDQVRFSVEVKRDGTVALLGLTRTGSASPVTVGDQPEALVTLDGATSRLGETGAAFLAQRVNPSTGSHFVCLSIRFASASSGLVATRHYVVYPNAAVIEMWTTFDTSEGSPFTVENLNAYSLALPAGGIDSVSGLDTAESDGDRSRDAPATSPLASD